MGLNTEVFHSALMLFLGISLESRHTRSAVFSLESNSIVAEARIEHSAETGTVFLDPSAWVRSVNESVHKCLQPLGGEARRLAGISVASPARGFVFLDAKNRLVIPRRRMEEASVEDVVKNFSRHFGGRPGMLELFGREIEPDSVAACLLWLKEHDPEVFSCVASVLQPHEFINYWLTGNRRGDASGSSLSGLMDVRTRQWSDVVMDSIDAGVQSLVSPLYSSKEVVGGLRPEVARDWGVIDHLLVAAGGSRMAMETLGVAAINPGEVVIDVEEGGRLRAVVEKPVVDPLGVLTLSCDAADQWILSKESRQSGGLVEEVKRQWGWGHDQFEQFAADSSVGAGGLSYHDGVLDGIVAGNMTPENMARSAMEAVVLEQQQALSHLDALGLSVARVRLLGGYGASTGWRQVLADALGMPVASGSPLASPSVGAALQAAVVYYQSTGENLTFTEVAEYALPVADGDWSYPNLEKKELYEKLAALRKREDSLWTREVGA